MSSYLWSFRCLHIEYEAAGWTFRVGSGNMTLMCLTSLLAPCMVYKPAGWNKAPEAVESVWRTRLQGLFNVMRHHNILFDLRFYKHLGVVWYHLNGTPSFSINLQKSKGWIWLPCRWKGFAVLLLLCLMELGKVVLIISSQQNLVWQYRCSVFFIILHSLKYVSWAWLCWQQVGWTTVCFPRCSER